MAQFDASSRNQWFGAAHALLWFDRNAGDTEWRQAPCDRMFRRIELATLRTGWDADAWSISAKGGDNRFSHGNLDLGTFVLDALGVRWAIDLGADNYGLEEERQMNLAILEPGGAEFEVEEIRLEPPAYPTPNTRKLTIKLPADRETMTIAVSFSRGDNPFASSPVVPLSQWGGRPTPR